MSNRPDVKAQATDFAKKRWADFQGFSPGQKAVTLVAVLALAIGGYLLATWKSDPTYAPLYSNLAASDASAIVSKLSDKGISYKLTDGGAGISVPAADVNTARLAVSAAGLPNSGQTGYALLDKEGVTTSQFQQQVDYQRAVEGELERTIQSIQGVQSASVHLAIPQQNVFSDGSSDPTAAVLLTVSAGTLLSSSQVESVVYLVSSSVQGMKTGDVAVTDSNGNVLSTPNGGVSGAVSSQTQMQTTQTYDEQMAASLQAAIDASLGPGHAKVIVNATLNFDKSTTNTSRYLPGTTAPLSESKTTEVYSGAGANTGGTLGTGSTSTSTTTTTGTGTSGNGNYNKSSDTVNNSVGTQTNTTEVTPGGIGSQHIAVLLDKNAKNLNTAAVTSIVQSAAGYNATRGDTMSVQAVPFDNSAQQQAAKAAKSAAAGAAAAKSHAQLIGLIKQGAFALLLIGLVVGTWLASRKRRAPADPQDSWPEDETLSIMEPVPTEAELAARRGAATEVQQAAERRRNLVRSADNRPAEVAHLLSGWLSTKDN